MHRTFALVLVALAPAWLAITPVFAEQPPRLNEANFDSLAPRGKEVDAIYGDYVLRNDWLVAVVAAPGEGRDANLTVRNVGGSVIDLTERDRQSDQLSAFYPGGGAVRFTAETDWRTAEWGEPRGEVIAFVGMVEGKEIEVAVGYEVTDEDPYVRVVTTATNSGGEPTEFDPTDGARVDGDTFKTGVDHGANLWWAADSYWGQAYGVQPEGDELLIDRRRNRDPRTPNPIAYAKERQDPQPIQLAPGESFTWSRRLFPAANNVALQCAAHRMLGESVSEMRVVVTDGTDPIADATVRVIRVQPDGERVSLGVARTDAAGVFCVSLPAGDYALRVRAEGHGSTTAEATLAADGAELDLELPRCAFAEATITDGTGEPIPVKVQFFGEGDIPNPDFGPESAVHGVKNLQYTADGTFRCKLLPGEYRWVASYGPEHDAAYGKFTVAAGETAEVRASLERSVDTTGWLSSELHSHSSPSGDNTASQRGRVLNLLAEHLEFCPCTEHQRLDVYDPHLEHFGATRRMLTCPGMELTGQPLPLNHQNAFPLKHKPHTQDGGGPETDPNPVAQIERLARWDNNSEKVVQTNHPDIAQMVGDRDENGSPDGGFEGMFGFMDVIEVHPPELIFEPLAAAEPTESGVGTGGWEGRGNSIVNWLQLLNLGYRVTGVVNTDAHYNWHGSGWMRNWVHSSTDDPAAASVAELVHGFEHGHVVMSNGPFLSVEASAGDARAIPGDDLATDRGAAKLRVVVRRPNWLEVNRVQLFLNGKPSAEHNYTKRTHPDWFADGAEVFRREIELRVERDTHVVVACLGEGQTLEGMYGVAEWGRREPVAVANPIFLDTNGDADADGAPFEANGDGLGLPLPTAPGLKPSHGHTHPNHRR